MCLLIRNLRQNPAKPFNSSNFRWRIFQKTDSGEYKPVFYYYDFKKNVWNKDDNTENSVQLINYGFHVFITRKDARKYKKTLDFSLFNYVIRKVKVRGFLRAGFNSDDENIRNETWKYLKIIE